MKREWKRWVERGLVIFYCGCVAPIAQGYSFDMVVPDVREPASLSGGSACPVAAHQLTTAGYIDLRWSTALDTSPVTIITQDQTAAGQLNEIEGVITQSVAVWTGVSGTVLAPATFGALTRTTTQNACGADGINSVCFDQLDLAFTPGVLAFARIVTADRAGIVLGSEAPSIEAGQIIDADVYFDPNDSDITFATPQALPANPKSYDMESLMIHELGHLLGFSHTAVWSAMMFPYAPAPGTYTGQRPTAAQPDGPLSEDDRTGLRVLYADPADTLHTGSISGRIVPANPLSLPENPPGVTGIFGAQAVAVNATTGEVVAATLGGWSCAAPGPAVFDGSYAIGRLPVGASYTVYAEPLNGAVGPSQVVPALDDLCRNSTTDPAWPPMQACVVPQADLSFTTRTLPGP
jgi:matrixin